MTKGGAHLPTASPFAKRGDMNKGGYRHTSKPQVDQGLLMKVFDNNSNLLGNMGIYERISRSQGCDPKGLIKLLPLIRGLVELEPTCEIHQSCLRKAIFSILLEDGTLNDSKWSGAVWTGMKVERVGVLLFHLRRLAGTDLKVAAAKLTGAEYLQLQNVVEIIKTKERPQAAPTAPPRQLKREVSDCSVNSNGMPNCFGTPQSKEQSPLTKRGKGSSLLLTKEEDSRQACPAVSFLRRRPGQTLNNPSQGQGSLRAELGLKKKVKNKKRNAKKKQNKKAAKKEKAAKPMKAAGVPKAGTLTKGAGSRIFGKKIQEAEVDQAVGHTAQEATLENLHLWHHFSRWQRQIFDCGNNKVCPPFVPGHHGRDQKEAGKGPPDQGRGQRPETASL